MIKLMSFNIRTASIDDGENAWDVRKPLVLSRISAFDPDLLGLQECRDDAQAEFVKQALPDYHFHGIRRGGGDDSAAEMAPLMFRRSAFRLLRQGHFWLSETPQSPGSKGWGAVFARTVSWVELRHLSSGRSFHFLNTHFDDRPDAVDGAAGLLRSWIDEQVGASPLLVTGDFNADRQSSAFRLLTGAGRLFDVHRSAHPCGRDEITYHGYGKATDAASLDWILASPHFRVIAADVDRTRELNRFASDHDPVTASVEWA